MDCLLNLSNVECSKYGVVHVSVLYLVLSILSWSKVSVLLITSVGRGSHVLGSISYHLLKGC